MRKKIKTNISQIWTQNVKQTVTCGGLPSNNSFGRQRRRTLKE